MGCRKLSYYSKDEALSTKQNFLRVLKEKSVCAEKIGIDYFTFGMIMPGRSYTSDNYRYGYNGMEKDDEIKGSGNSLDFGARIYDPRLGRWLSVDPLAEKYPGLSPYNFAGSNPILYKDPDGKKILIYYKDAEGNKMSYEYGSKVKVPDNEFVKNAVEALDHLKQNDFANKIITKVETDQNKNINLHSGKGAESDGFTFSYKNGGLTDDKINWDPEAGLETTNGDNISPSTALFHEIGHNFNALYSFVAFWTRTNTPDAQYTDKEEEFTTKLFENEVAKFFGEAERKDHKGKPIVTESVTSNRESVVPLLPEQKGKEVVLE